MNPALPSDPPSASGPAGAPVGIAVVGIGAFAREHLVALAALPGADVRWVVGHDLARTRALAALVPGARATTSLDEALADDAVHAVDVVTATPAHARDTIAAGEAGRHVQVEKPAALSLAQLDTMVAATEGRGTTLVVGQTVRFQPAVAALAAAARRGEIGTPRLAHVSWYTGHAWPGGWRGWQLDPELSGGHPVHNGTHILDVATWLLDDEPVEVFARGFRTFSPEMESPDSFHVQLRTASGALATLELCYALRRRGELVRRVVLVGTEGTLAHSTTEEDGLHSDATTAPPVSVEGALGIQLAHWLDVVRGDAAPVVTTPQVRAALATALAAQRSLVSGRRERVADVPGYAPVEVAP
ncbi:Gfo/Idh/MocA family protein [Cellulosimicrobium sp. SH8]|uniref:Gfo/Idh/MocA family protein n=1 Tax=Cellulosimicrobium sp. SH8 TaxID=2952936 RepID=UPI0021F28FFE|nr:Gfo/Idh/MocA family oxidoreductase [Cellulosimicrobium sp. SH8]